MTKTENMKTFAEQHATLANDVLLKWVSTLSVGNGAALFATFSLGLKDGKLLFPLVTVICGWLFLLGLVTASLAFVSVGSASRHHEMYWHLSAVRSEMPGPNYGDIQQKIDDADSKGERAEDTAKKLAVPAGLAFIAGLVVPLIALTARLFPT